MPGIKENKKTTFFFSKKTSSQDLLRAHCYKIDVPHDGSCLFWATALAYLAELGKGDYAIRNDSDDIKFNLACKKLFGIIDKKTINTVKMLINRFLIDFDYTVMSFHHDFRRLITHLFRGRVVDLMRECEDEFKSFITGDFDAYLGTMRSPIRFAGEPEIKAIAKLLGCNIKIVDVQRQAIVFHSSKLKDEAFRDQEEDAVIQLDLFYKANERHYFFGLDEKRSFFIEEFQQIADHVESFCSNPPSDQTNHFFIAPFQDIANNIESLFYFKKKKLAAIRFHEVAKERLEEDQMSSNPNKYAGFKSLFKKIILGSLFEWSLHIHLSAPALTYFFFRKQVEYPLLLTHYPNIVHNLESNAVWEREIQEKIDAYLNSTKIMYIGVSGALLGLICTLYHSKFSSSSLFSFFSKPKPSSQEENEENTNTASFRLDTAAHP